MTEMPNIPIMIWFIDLKIFSKMRTIVRYTISDI